jgi:hypothetical protein
MDHIKLTSSSFYSTDDLIPDAVMENDDLTNIKRLAGLTDLNAGRLQEYKGEGSVSTEGSNISKTAMEKSDYQHKHNIQPGTPEWFRLWFTRPYLTNTTPF